MMTVHVAAGLGPRRWWEIALQMPMGATVADALLASQAMTQFGADEQISLILSVWSAPVAKTHVLKDGDRLELNRPLRVDPKTARRERFAKQGARSTGLFARLRPGGKKGY